MFEVKEKIFLKQCPFCGGNADLYGLFVPTGEDEINVYVCGCNKCDVKFQEAWDYDEIVKKWNTRS